VSRGARLLSSFNRLQYVKTHGQLSGHANRIKRRLGLNEDLVDFFQRPASSFRVEQIDDDTPSSARGRVYDIITPGNVFERDGRDFGNHEVEEPARCCSHGRHFVSDPQRGDLCTVEERSDEHADRKRVQGEEVEEEPDELELDPSLIVTGKRRRVAVNYKVEDDGEDDDEDDD